jgi:DNA-binding MarR family transcriptional regulator
MLRWMFQRPLLCYQAIAYAPSKEWPARRIDAAALVIGYGEAIDMPTPFTAKQGQYLAFIYYYSKIHGMPPAEADFRRFFRVTPPVVHQMIKTLHARRFIDREPGKARTIRLRLTRAELPDLD